MQASLVRKVQQIITFSRLSRAGRLRRSLDHQDRPDSSSLKYSVELPRTPQMLLTRFSRYSGMPPLTKTDHPTVLTNRIINMLITKPKFLKQPCEVVEPIEVPNDL